MSVSAFFSLFPWDRYWLGYLCIVALAILQFRKDLKDGDFRGSLMFFIFSIFIGVFTMSDSKKTGEELSSIIDSTEVSKQLLHTVGKLGEATHALNLSIANTTNENNGLSKKNLSLSDTIRIINKRINSVDSAILALSKKINGFVTGDGSYPYIIFPYILPNDDTRKIILLNVGKFPLHGLSIDLYDNSKMTAIPGDDHSTHYDVDELSSKKLLGKLQLHDWQYDPVQKFTMNIVTTNGKYNERACFTSIGYAISVACWVMKYRDASMITADTLVRPSFDELRPFIAKGYTIQQLVAFR